MSDFRKIALLVLNGDGTEFLVCAKAPDNVTGDFIMPGGQLETEEEIDCLVREIKEELDCGIDRATLKLVGNYQDIAAGFDATQVHIRLYQGKLKGEPRPSSEVKKLDWVGRKDQANEKVSPIIRNKIIPDLVSRGLLK